MRNVFLLGCLALCSEQYAQAGVSSDAVLYFGASKQVSEKVSFDAYGGLFWGQSFGTILVTYTGPRFQIGKYYGVNAHVGLITNWPESGRNYYLLSVWQTVLLGDSKWSIFTESTLVPSGQSAHFVGTYVLSYSAQHATPAVHAVQFDTTVSVGPRLTVPVSEHFSAGLQYHWYVGTDSHVLRVAFHVQL